MMALLAVLMAAPNNTFLKAGLTDVGPLWISFARFTLLALVLTPFLYFGRDGLNAKSFRYSLIAGVAYATAVLSMAGAIFYSQASYPALIGISSPIIMMFYSVWITNERVSKKSYFGVIVAAIGSFLIIFVPVLFSGGRIPVNPIATVLAVLNAFSSPLMIVMMRKAIDSKMSVWTGLGVVGWVGVVMVGLSTLMLRLPLPQPEVYLKANIILPIVYSVLVVMLLARGLTAIALKKLGSAQIASLDYLGIFLAIIIPILSLGERLSVEMVIGGGLILAGVIAIRLKYTPKWLRQRKLSTMIQKHSTIE